MLPSALVPSIADEAPTYTFAFSTPRSFLHLRFLFLLRTSVLTVINPTHRNHHQSTRRHTPGHLPAHTRTAINTIHLNHHRNNNPQGRKTSTRPKGQDWFYHPVRVFLAGGAGLDHRPNHCHMEWRGRRCRATSGPPMWSRSSVRRCESGGIPRIAPHSRRSKSLRLHDRPGNGQRSPGDGPSASDERCSSTCRSQ